MTVWLPLVILWLATAGLFGGLGVLAWIHLRESVNRHPANVIVLPPRADRGGPTHVIKRATPYDQDRQPEPA